ncbi:MAG: SRPBCC family protein [Solirubrobacteraceae bacterium]
MKLHNEFTVDAPVEQAWPVLLDIQRVSTCLPGATMEPGGEDGVYRGTMKVKLGPITTTYQGTARLEEVDEDTHTASIAVQAKEQRGQGTAAAVITNRLVGENGRTRVVAETDLNVTGRPAQFGRGIMEDVAGSMLTEFAARFERELSAGGPAPAGEAAAVPAPAPEAPDVLDIGRVVAGTGVTRYATAAGAALAAVVLAGVLRGRTRRGISIAIRYRW